MRHRTRFEVAVAVLSTYSILVLGCEGLWVVDCEREPDRGGAATDEAPGEDDDTAEDDDGDRTPPSRPPEA